MNCKNQNGPTDLAGFVLILSCAVAPQTALAARAATTRPGSQPAHKTVDKAYPRLATGVLTFARLTQLPKGTLLRSGDLELRESDLREQFNQVPNRLKEQFKSNMFFLLEQVAARKLLANVARSELGQDKEASSEQTLVKAYLGRIADDVKVSDAEVQAFYEQNKDLCGGAALDQIRDQLAQYVRQQKRQEAVTEYVRTLGQRVDIEMSGRWAARQAKMAMNNPVDKARGNGKPTMVDFGASGCRPCDMMTPILKTLEKKYEGKANILFVHVREQEVLAGRYGVRSIPTQAFFDKEGREVFRHTGFYPQADIERQLENLGAK